MRIANLIFACALTACTRGGQDVPPEPGAGADEARADPSAAPDLVGPVWVLAELPGTSDITGNGGRAPDLRFADDGNAGGFAGCNSMGGSYEASGDSLSFGPLIMTMMACEDGMEVERAYSAALERVVRFRRQGTTLELMDDSTIVARLEAGSAE